MSRMPACAAARARSAYMSRNFHVVSTCSSGNGGPDGWNALRAKSSITALSLPIEYSIPGRSASATTSRRIWMLSASSRSRWVRPDKAVAGSGSRCAHYSGRRASGWNGRDRLSELLAETAIVAFVEGARGLAEFADARVRHRDALADHALHVGIVE